MTETQKRIRELKKALPAARERIVAVAALLSLSLTMMASVSYAWITLSRSPEVGGVHTTVSANGSLEVALSGKDGLEPNSSGINDSFAAEGQTVHGANTTWGNLINLSSGYGLESLILRPATFDNNSPAFLAGAKYGDDGRVEGSLIDFAFTSWESYNEGNTTKWGFLVPEGDAFGLRAISSVGFPDGKGALYEMLTEAQRLAAEANTAYGAVTKDGGYNDVIHTIVQKYLDANISALIGSYTGGSGEVDIDIKDEVPDLLAMLDDFYNLVIVKFGEVLAYTANIQQYYASADGVYESYTWQQLLTASSAELKSRGVSLNNTLTKYIDLEKSVREDRDYLKSISGQNVKWSQVESVVDNLIKISKVKVNGKTVADVRGMGTGALNWVKALPDKTDITVFEGSLWNYEDLSGSRMLMNVPVKISAIIVNKSTTGQMHTSLTARDVSRFSNDLAVTEKLAGSSGNKGNMQAQDTYGMVIDLWFRTNSGSDDVGTLLTLDGLPKIEYELRPLTHTPSGDATQRLVYVFKRPTGASYGGVELEEEIEVYEVPGADANENGVIDDEEYRYYYVETALPVYTFEKQETTDADGNKTTTYVETETPANKSNSSLTQKFYEHPITTGFMSSNRIEWDDEFQDEINSQLGTNEMSATQGSGSCYTFYADGEEAYENAKRLLGQMRLTFVDVNGHPLAYGRMDTEHIFGEAGKYIVPLVIDSSDFSVEVDGSVVNGITMLKKNVAQRISVVIYLEGQGLENYMVMSNQSITGSLNLQFSTTESLESVQDSELGKKTISLSTNITTGAGTSSDINHELFHDYKDGSFTPTLTAYVDGLSPATVQAVFQRKINATQGKKTDPIDLTHIEGSVWSGVCNFTKPGTYELNSLLVDGVEYSLPEGERITVTVTGIKVESVLFCADAGTEREFSTGNSTERSVTLTFAADSAYLPNTVEAKIKSSNGGFVTAVLKRQADGSWKGTAKFTSSGVYTMSYILVDGDEMSLSESQCNSLTAYLGLTTEVYLEREGGLSFIYEVGKPETIGVSIKILTDTNEELKGLNNVVLQYRKLGSNLNEAGLKTDYLNWDGKNYVGEFKVAMSGSFYFSDVTIAGQQITKALVAAPIHSRSIAPVAYVNSAISADANSLLSQNSVVLGQKTDNLYYVVEIKNADTREGMKVHFKFGGQTYIVDNYDKIIGNRYYFKVPTVNGSREGTWTVDTVEISGVYDNLGNYFGTQPTAADVHKGVWLTVSVEPAYTFSVIDNFTVELIGGAVSGGDFMSDQKIAGSGLGVKITNPNLPAMNMEVKSVILTLEWIDGSEEHGGYKTTDNNVLKSKDYATITMSLVYVDGVWIPNDRATACLAGRYGVQSLTYTIGSTEEGSSVPATSIKPTVNKNDILIVKSNAPKMEITSVSSNVSTDRYYKSSTPNSLNVVTGSFNQKTADGSAAAVYMYVGEKTGSLDQEQVTIKYPSVTIRASGLPADHSGITMNFTSTNENGTRTYPFVFSAGSTSASCTIGSGTSGTFDEGILGIGSGVSVWPVFYPAGKMSQSQITVTCDGIQYTVNTNTITINNPQYPPYVTYASTSTSGLALQSVPAGQYATLASDGNLVVTLPAAQTWTTAGSRQVGDPDAFAPVSGYPKTENVYTTRSETTGSGCDAKETTYYQPYIKTTQRQVASGTKYTWVDTHTIVKWKVGNQQYDPGKTVVITGDQTITAVLNTVHGTETGETTTVVQEKITYAVNGDETTTKPTSGSPVDSATSDTDWRTIS